MPIVTYDFHGLWRLDPEALGEPGKRSFRLVAENDGGRAIMWAEKQHLQGLAMAIHQIVSATQCADRPVGDGESVVQRGSRAPVHTTIIMRTDRFELGVDASTDSFVLLAHDQEAADTAPHIFACRPSLRQLAALAESIEILAAAGRRRCPVCGQPLEMGVEHQHNQLEAGN